MPDLPEPETTILCGVCKTELTLPEDVLVCEDCQLVYTSPDVSGDYLDPEVEPCGADFHLAQPSVVTRPFRTFQDTDGTKTVLEYRTTTTTYSTCQLPATHASGMHYHPEHRVMAYHPTPEVPSA